MTADQLRRAAAKLREHAEAATPGPWVVETHVDGYDDTVLYLITGPTGDDGVTPIPLQMKTEDAGNFSQAEADVCFGALMHPPLAQAIAAMLEDEAEQTDDNGELYCVSGGTLGIARAVLREDGESR